MRARHLFRLALVVGICAPGMTILADSSIVPTVENGDYNGDGSRNLTDVVNMFHYLFTEHAVPAVPVAARCEIVDAEDGSKIGHYESPLHNGDVNGDGFVNLADCIYFLNWLFAGGDEPVEIDCGIPSGSA